MDCSPWGCNESDMNEFHFHFAALSYMPWSIEWNLPNSTHNCIGQRHGRGWLKSNKAPLSLSLRLNHLCYYPLSYCFLLSSPLLHSPGEEKGPDMLKNLYSFITCISSLFLLNGFLKIAVKVTCYKAYSFNHI